jgi:hypothetical protein
MVFRIRSRLDGQDYAQTELMPWEDSPITLDMLRVGRGLHELPGGAASKPATEMDLVVGHSALDGGDDGRRIGNGITARSRACGSFRTPRRRRAANWTAADAEKSVPGSDRAVIVIAAIKEKTDPSGIRHASSLNHGAEYLRLIGSNLKRSDFGLAVLSGFLRVSSPGARRSPHGNL